MQAFQVAFTDRPSRPDRRREGRSGMTEQDNGRVGLVVVVRIAPALDSRAQTCWVAKSIELLWARRGALPSMSPSGTGTRHHITPRGQFPCSRARYRSMLLPCKPGRYPGPLQYVIDVTF